MEHDTNSTQPETQAPAKKTRKPRAKKDDATKPVSRSVIAATYKKVHVPAKMSERMSLLVRGGNANDPVDPKLFGQLCRANGIPANRWEGKNIGMQFMNLSNVLRHREERGEKVVIALAPRKPRGKKAQETEAPAVAAE